MKVLFFDTAKHVGWGAFDGERVTFGNYTLRDNRRHGAVLVEFTRFVVGKIEELQPDVIGAEHPRLHPTDTEHKLRRLYGYVNVVDQAAWRRNIEYHEPTVEKIRRHFLGKGYPKKSGEAKTAVCNQCRMLGWKVTTDDEGDALAGLDYVRALLRPMHALNVVPMFGGDNGKSKTKRTTA